MRHNKTAAKKTGNKKTVAILGGAGFIGAFVNKAFFKAGYETIVVDDLRKGDKKNVLFGTLIQKDFGNQKAMEKLFQDFSIDAVIHLASEIDIHESILNPLKYYQNNVVNTLSFLSLLQKTKVRYFIFSSSASVYGIPKTKKIKENHPCFPITPYGETKWIVEKILQDCQKAFGLHFTSLRYFNAAGGDRDKIIQRKYEKETHLIPKLFENLMNKKKSIHVYGNTYPTKDGSCIRDFVHVEDLAEAHVLALEALFKKKTSTVYNLGSGTGFSVLEVIKMLEKVTKKKIEILYDQKREGDPPFLVADITKAKKELGWTPKYSLEMMIEDGWNFRKMDTF